jgi:hypothetical protein
LSAEPAIPACALREGEAELAAVMRQLFEAEAREAALAASGGGALRRRPLVAGV